MLIHCHACGTAHQLMQQAVPEAGLRIKCSRCGEEIQVAGGARSLPPPVVVPPKVAEAAPRQPAGPRKKRKRRRRPNNRDRTSGKDGSVRTLSTPKGEEKTVDERPSIMVDLGQISSSQNPVVTPEAPPVVPDDPVIEAAAAFAPLSTTSPAIARPAAAPRPVVTAFDVPELEEPIRPIGPPRLGKTVFLILAFGAIGFVLFVWARNAWGPIWEAPALAVQTALGQAPEITAPVDDDTPTKIGVAPEGKIEVTDLSVRFIKQRDRRFAAIIGGEVLNATRWTQHHINLSVRLERDGTPFHQRTIGCCNAVDKATAEAIAADAKHPHHDPAIRAKTALKTMAKARFTVVLRGIESPDGLAPVVDVSFHEPATAP